MAGGPVAETRFKATQPRTCVGEDEQNLKPLRQGWGLGREAFRQKMIELMEDKLGENHAGELRQETAEQKGSRVSAEELACLDAWPRQNQRRSCRFRQSRCAARTRIYGPLSLHRVP